MQNLTPPDSNRENNPPWVRPLAVAIQNTLDVYLSTDPEGAAELEKLRGATVRVSCEHPFFSLYFTATQNRIEVDWTGSVKPQACVSAALGDWLQIGLSRGKSHSGINLNISGDVSMAQNFLKILSNVAFDCEALIARYAGDRAAHHLGQSARRLGSWQTRARQVFAESFSEYLQEEARLTPSRYELEGFLDEVDKARNDIERLSRRFESMLNKKGK